MSRIIRVLPLIVAATGFLTGNPVMAADLTPAQTETFERHVRPLLTRHCVQCHGPKKQEGGLKLTSLAAMLQGGDSGPALVPGNPDESLLIEALRYESFEMPPAEPLPDEHIAALASWIQQGAAWPEGTVLVPTVSATTTDRDWWCYQPLSDPQVPDVDTADWGRNEIDQFVVARLLENGVGPSRAAAAETLARRLNFAVTGLPPADSARQFVQGDLSYDQLVDQLLDQPSFGENQARYWLDLVRYAESDGYRADHERPEARKYRDYVIASFNADKPYDQFIVEQLAGDETDPGNRDALIGTMFLRHWIYEYNQRDVEGQWSEILDDITQTTADVFLAQGIKCARCHDHKFDPILQSDYFRIRAFFAGFMPREDMPVATVEQRAAWLQQQTQWLEATEEIRRELHSIERPALLKHARGEGFSKFVTEIKDMMSARVADRSPYEHQIASLAERQLKFQPEKLSKQLAPDQETRRQQLRQQLAEFDKLKPEPLPVQKFVSSDVGAVVPVTYVPDDPQRTPVEPGYLSILDDRPAGIEPPNAALQSSGRRTALARWIASPDNPLTARVIVNRVWQQYFGRGLVDTSSDFGHLGTPPSHPLLLDWLASRLIEENWSLKKLHRRILLSATFRQASDRVPDQTLTELDPGNVLLWKMNPRRLSGEEITDAILTASGELNEKKRAIYLPVIRNKRNPLLALFDFPDRIRSAGERHRTTTSPQALMLMNNPWALERATEMANRFEDDSPKQLTRHASRELFFRDPGDHEVAAAQDYLASYAALTPPTEQPAGKEPVPSSEVQARVSYLHALLNSNELIYVD